MDWTLYWFMFPISIGVSTASMLSGIGGAALFTPIFLLIFPILGPEYPLATPVAAVGAALFTQLFGFSSGFIGYLRQRLMDFRGALPFIVVSVPLSVLGAFLAYEVDQSWLKMGYAILMLVLAVVLLGRSVQHRDDVSDAGRDGDGEGVTRTIVSRAGTSYTYPRPRLRLPGAVGTGVGGFLTGMLSVGIGEIVMPLLLRAGRVPLPVAAATSVYVVIVVVASASFTHATALVSGGGLSAVPWNLVCWTIPGVILGGQIGPRMQGAISQQTMERVIAILFGVIGLSMAVIAAREFGLVA